MCTVSWNYCPDGLHVFCNRDEQRSRPKARPPERHTSATGANYLAPIDPVGGGSWIAVNDQGLLVTLLNYYQRQSVVPPAGPATSRGLLVTGLMDCGTPDAVSAILATRVKHARAFHLIAAHPDHPVRAWTWDGATLTAAPNPTSALPWSSSSFQTDDVLAWRSEQYQNVRHAPSPLQAARAFHATRHPEVGAFGICMERDDACTQSFSHITIGANNIAYRYTDGFPDDSNAPTSLTNLPRSGGVS